MSFRNRAYDFLFYLVAGTLYTYALSRAVFDATVVEVADTWLLLLSLTGIFACYWLFFNRRVSIVTIAALLIAGAGLFLSLRHRQFEVAWFLRLREVLGELVLFAGDQLPYREVYGRYLSVAACGALALFTALNLRLHFGFYLLTLLGAGVVAVPIAMDWGRSDRAIFLFVLCFVAFLSKKLNLFAAGRRASASSGGANAGFALMALPVSALVALAAWTLPKPVSAHSGNYDPQGTAPQNLLDAADNLLSGIGPNYTVSFTEEGGRLGGPNRQAERPVMTVWCEEPLYFSGSVRDTYTGSSWVASSRTRRDIGADSAGWYATSEYDALLDDRQQYYMRFYGRTAGTATVSIDDSRTRTLFAPPFRTALRFFDDAYSGEIAIDPHGALSAASTLRHNTAYTQSYYSWNYSNPYFVGMLQGLQPSDVQGDGLAPYLALPASLPDRVYALARSLADGLPSQYDRLKAIEAYLAAFPYTLEPDNVPGGEDFVDYFLFTGQEGYCVYYASALAVMARCVDIPTRYVEGFALPQAQNADGSYSVTTLQAHAWVEAYLHGFGWVPFEATPANYAGFYGEEPPAATDPIEAPALQEAETGALPEAESTTLGPPAPEAPTEPPGDKSAAAGQKNAAGRLLLIGLLVLALCAAGARILLSRYRARRRQLECLPADAAVEAYFSRILLAAAAYGYPRLPNETAHAYALRVGDALPPGACPVALGELADIFARAAYSGQEVGEGELQLMQGAYHALADRLRQKMGRPAYYLKRYLLLHF